MNLDSRSQISLILLAVLLLSLILFPPTQIIFFHILVSIFAAVFLDSLFLRLIQHKTIYFPRSGLVTGLLLALILDPRTPIWVTFLAATLAIGSKYVITSGPRHLFNPTGFGLLGVSLLFAAIPSWWGVAANPWSIPILIIGASLVLIRLRLWSLPLQFLAVYALYLVIKTGQLQSLRRFWDPTVILFAFVMLTEPQTLPLLFKWRRIFGLLVAGILLILLEIGPILSLDPLLTSLLLANLTGWLLSRLSLSLIHKS